MKNKFFLLLAVFFLGTMLRFYELGNFPISLHRDEAFLGYNAYSILKTGKDMSDNLLPMHLESFIYSPAGYSYFSIPFIAIFDLNEFSVRTASAFFGSLTILVIYFLARQLFTHELSRISSRIDTNTLAFLAAFFLAVSPWHINLSRTATENIIVVFFLLLGVLFFLIYLKNGYRYLFLSFLFFGITLLLYQAPRAFLPIFIPFLILVFMERKKIIKDKLILGFFYLLAIILPTILILVSPDLSLRIRSLSIFHNDYTNTVLTEQITNDGVARLPYIATRIFHNKIIGHSLLFLENYFKHFNFDFLFLQNGFPDRYRVPMMGLLYIFELPLIFLGLTYLFQKNKRLGIFLLGWILITPIGSALTSDDIPNLQRTLIGFPPYVFLSAFGLISLLGLGRRSFGIFIFPMIFIVIYGLGYYLVQYYSQAVNYKTWYRQDGYKNLVYKVNELLPKYEKAIITNTESAPTVFFLFYNKYDPSLFQKATYLSSHRSFDRMNFGKYEFTEDECPLKNEEDGGAARSSGVKNILYVNSALCKEFPENSELLAEIRRRDNSSVFYILDSK